MNPDYQGNIIMNTAQYTKYNLRKVNRNDNTDIHVVCTENDTYCMYIFIGYIKPKT